MVETTLSTATEQTKDIQKVSEADGIPFFRLGRDSLYPSWFLHLCEYYNVRGFPDSILVTSNDSKTHPSKIAVVTLMHSLTRKGSTWILIARNDLLHSLRRFRGMFSSPVGRSILFGHQQRDKDTIKAKKNELTFMFQNIFHFWWLERKKSQTTQRSNCVRRKTRKCVGIPSDSRQNNSDVVESVLPSSQAEP